MVGLLATPRGFSHGRPGPVPSHAVELSWAQGSQRGLPPADPVPIPN